MKTLLQELSNLLQESGITFKSEEGSLRIPLPAAFGELEVGILEDGDSIIGLVGSDWHTHGDQLRFYGGTADAEVVHIFLQEIYAGKILLIEEQEPNKESRKTIEDDLEAYLKYLPAGTQYRIYNAR